MRNLPRFDGRSSFGTWAYRIATNASLDELRKRDRRPRLDNDDDAIQLVDEHAAHDVDDVGDRMILDQALADLPDDLRAAVVLRDVADLDYAEIAAALEIPAGTVKSRISRGRAALAQRLRLDLDLPLSPDPGNQPPSDERPTDRT